MLAIIRDKAPRPWTSNHDRSVLARDVLSLVERLEAAERERDEADGDWVEIAATQAARANAAESRVERLEEALRFYADKVSWHAGPGDIVSDAVDDYGLRARSVLLHPEEEGKD